MSTKSVIPSSSERERIEATLTAFVEGRCSLAQLVESLHDYIVVDFSQAPNSREIRNLGLRGLKEIPVGRRHLRNMLEHYMNGEISEMDLSNWAAFIMALDFIPEGETEEERAAEGDGPVWDIIHRLTTPMIFDGLSREVAQYYLDMLD